jgi:hypothetical protein
MVIPGYTLKARLLPTYLYKRNPLIKPAIYFRVTLGSDPCTPLEICLFTERLLKVEQT